MSAGVGKTYRMLQEAHSLFLRNGIDVKIGYIETHSRKETNALLDGLPVIPRRKLFYKGKKLEELDVQAVINLRLELISSIRTDITELMRLNMEAIERKSNIADATAQKAILIISVTGTLCFLIAFILLVNLPSGIANPIKELT